MTLRRTAIARKTELARGGPLRRKTAMARVAAAKRTVAKQRAQRDTGPTSATKALLWDRAHGRCERCGRDLTGGYPFSRHHRRRRGMGGSSAPWINDITNLLLLCGSATTPDGCHAAVEKKTPDVFDAGWCVRAGSQYLPAEIPVVVLHRPVVTVIRRFCDAEGHALLGHERLELVYLTADGGYAKGVA